MQINTGPQSLKDLFGNKPVAKKPPAHQWQDFALTVIDQLAIPGHKRNSVFKICKDYPRDFVLKCVNDTKELCKTGEQWKYFFKVVETKRKSAETDLTKSTQPTV